MTERIRWTRSEQLLCVREAALVPTNNETVVYARILQTRQSGKRARRRIKGAGPTTARPRERGNLDAEDVRRQRSHIPASSLRCVLADVFVVYFLLCESVGGGNRISPLFPGVDPDQVRPLDL